MLDDGKLEWNEYRELPKDDKERLAFYDKLVMEAFLRHIKLEFIVFYNDRKDVFHIFKKRQIVTYDQKLEG
jgi:hypothetical protein